MKNYKYLLFLLLVLNSCKKEAIDNPISLFTFGSDRILQKTRTSFYLGVGFYIREGQNKDKESLSLTVAGATAKLVQNKLVDGRVTALFQVPGINTPGDHKVVFTYSNGSNTSIEEKTIRVISDFSIASIWDKLDQKYVKENNFLTYVYQSNEFQFEPPPTIYLGNGPKTGLALDIGEYRANFSSSSKDYISKPFIVGLDGSYTAYYENNSIKEIWVSIADTYKDPFFNMNEFISQLTKLYGTPTENYGKYLFKVGAFDIEIDYFRYVQAVIKKTR